MSTFPNASTKTLVLIDGSSYLYRAFHALPPLTNSKGQPTGAIYGVISMIKRLLVDHKPDYLGVVFDAKGKTFRDDLYPDYKSHRSAMPDDLVSQVEPLFEVIRAMGLPLLSIERVEADDVIATLAKQAEQQNIPVLISTGDKDLAQLVNDHITLVNTMTNTIYDRAGVIKKFGIPPEKIIDYLSLVGDTSDNIPGVPGCGPKTAVKWLTEYGSLDNLISNASKVSGKVGENLRQTIPALPLSRELVTIRLDVPLHLKVHELTIKPRDEAKLNKLYQHLEFKTWLAELMVKAAPIESQAIITTQRNYQTVLTQAALDQWFARLKKADLFAFDTETTSLSYMDAEIVGVSFAINAHEACYIPIAHDYIGAPTQLSRDVVFTQLKPLLENPQYQKIGQHIKYDMNVLNNYGIQLRGITYDTMLESYVLNSTASRHDMNSLAEKYLHVTPISFEDVAGKGKNQLTFNQVPMDKATEYAAEDADVTLQLHQTLWPELNKIPKLVDVFNDIEMPLVTVLSKMECTGVLIDKDHLHKLSKEFADKMATLSKEIFHEAGQEFNIDSPKQLQEILFEKMGLPIVKKTATGQASTAEPILQELAHNYRLPALIMEYRTCAKLKSTYTDKLPTLINARTGRVHTSYHQAITSTGRLSSSDPNLQNIPIREEAGRAIRRAFIAPPHYQIISADYSQVELRIMAHLSGDKRLLEAFALGEDIHQATAAEVFGVPLDKVSSEQRRSAKVINFGLLYGMSIFGLAKQLQVPRHESQAYIDAYFKRYPGVKAYMDNTRQQARDKGYVETLSGRRLYLPGIHDRNKMLQQAAERAAINAPMQGTAADIIKLAMINLDHKLPAANIDAKMIMQVHDELVFEVHQDHIEPAKAMIKQEMEHAFKLHVPLVVDVMVGKNWEA